MPHLLLPTSCFELKALELSKKRADACASGQYRKLRQETGA